MKPTVRHVTAPTPLGCRWCGTTEREHGQRWVPGHGWHGWVEPTRQQIEARMRVRLAARRAARPVVPHVVQRGKRPPLPPPSEDEAEMDPPAVAPHQPADDIHLPTLTA